MTTITRIGFCPKCFAEKRAKTGQLFMAVGSSHTTSKVVSALHNGRAGFVPTLYQMQKVVDKKVYYKTLCCMNECGTYEFESNGKKYLSPVEDAWSNWKKMSITNWNALVLFKDTGFEI